MTTTSDSSRRYFLRTTAAAGTALAFTRNAAAAQTGDWFARNAERLSLESSLRQVLDRYSSARA